MPPPPPPSNVLPYLQQASQATGIPLPVVEAQNNMESGYGSNNGPSSAGALGPWQFEPQTWNDLGFPAGQENSWSVSTQAYIKYMDQLLQQEGGSIFKALEAYNAGPGNITAGAGYATTILNNAGVSQTATAGKQVQTTAANINIPLPIPGFPSISTGSLGTIGSSILSIFGVPDFKDLFERLALMILGFALLIVGIAILTKSGGKSPITINTTTESSEAKGTTTRTREVHSPVGRNVTRSSAGGVSAAKSTGSKEALEAVSLG